MAEKITIQNFKYGVDTRRSELTSQPGTLVMCQNGHINQGGEVEKRKAFVLFAATGILDTNGDQGVFGLESTSSGIMRFGSAIVFGGSVTQGQPTLLSAIPTTSPVTVYQQLQHPAVVDGATYSRAIHLMTGVFSTVYKGKAFVLATFADGKTFMYFDGSLVQQSRNGIVLTGRTSLANLGTELAREFNAISGWSSTTNGDTLPGGIALATVAMTGGGSGATITPIFSNGVVLTASISAGGTGYAVGDLVLVKGGMVLKVTTISGGAITAVTIQYPGLGAFNGLDVVKSPVGVSFSPTPSETSVNGLVNTDYTDADGNTKTYGEIDTNAPGFGAVASWAAFTLTGTNGHVSVTAPANADGSGTALLATAVAFHTNLNITASDIVTAINQGTMFHGYSASSTGASAVVTVVAPTNFGNVTFDLTVTNVDGDLGSGGGTPAAGLVVTLNPGTVTKSRVGTGSAAMAQTEAASVSGGTSPYTYQWAEQSPGSGGGIICSGGSANATTGVFAAVTASVSFNKVLLTNQSITALLKCTVTDSAGVTGVTNFSVTLENDNLN